MAEKNDNLWAPWRIQYIEALDGEDADGCFLCRYWQSPKDDRRNRVVSRSERAFIVMNRFPYTNGHLMICPIDHVGDLAALDEAAYLDMMRMTRAAVRLLIETIHPHGFNVGINIGRCAGAGLPDHVHTHVVPRWGGDTNYMAILGDVRVIPQSLDALYDRLRAAVGAMDPHG